MTPLLASLTNRHLEEKGCSYRITLSLQPSLRGHRDIETFFHRWVLLILIFRIRELLDGKFAYWIFYWPPERTWWKHVGWFQQVALENQVPISYFSWCCVPHIGVVLCCSLKLGRDVCTLFQFCKNADARKWELTDSRACIRRQLRAVLGGDSTWFGYFIQRFYSRWYKYSVVPWGVMPATWRWLQYFWRRDAWEWTCSGVLHQDF